jgi:hypothetical protein
MPFEKEFSILRKWRFRINNFGIFQKADVRDAFLKGYAPVRQWPELNTIESMPAFSHPTKLENGGVYWRLWPFSFEDYRTEHEPDVRDLPQDLRMPVRIIMWQRKNGVRAPQGWFGFSDRPFLKVGFVPVEPGYSKQWSETSLRELKRWRRLLAAKRYTCRRITYEEFSDGYLKSTLPLLLRQSMLYEVKVRMRNSKTPVTFFGAERISDGKIVAGLAVMESPELGISYYLAGFFKKQVQDEPVMAGLFDFWFQDGIARGLKFIDFGNFWKPGDESSWKGFSMFKAKFNPLYFFYPAKLYKFRWGK